MLKLSNSPYIYEPENLWRGYDDIIMSGDGGLIPMYPLLSREAYLIEGLAEYGLGNTAEAIETIREEIESNTKMLAHVEEKMEKFKAEKREQLSVYEVSLKGLSSTYELQKYVVVYGQRASISGFIPENKEEALKEVFKDYDKVEIEINDPYTDYRLVPPTKLKNNSSL